MPAAHGWALSCLVASGGESHAESPPRITSPRRSKPRRRRARIEKSNDPSPRGQGGPLFSPSSGTLGCATNVRDAKPSRLGYDGNAKAGTATEGKHRCRTV